VGPSKYDLHSFYDFFVGDEYVIRLWFASNNRECSAKLKDALVGEERERLWESLKEFLVDDIGETSADITGTSELNDDITNEIP